MEAIARSLGAVRAPHCLPSPRHVQALRRLSGFRGTRLAPRLPQNVRNLATATGGKVTITKEGLELAPEGVWGVKRWVLPSFWLRDNCRCVKCVNQDTRQRNFDTFQIPADVAPVKAEADSEGVKVSWSHEDHESHYSWRFLTNWLQHDVRKPEHVDFKYWGAEVKDNPPTVTFEEVMKTDSEAGIAKLTSLVREYGFAFVDGTPFDDPNRTKELLERIAFIRETHYGGFYDFIPDLAKADTAYTNLALAAHTDTTYFTDPAGLQAFHLLSHTPPPSASKDAPAEGGESLLVDGFHAARILYEEDREAYEILHAVKLPWHASGNQGITIAPDKRYPVLEVDDSTGDLHTLHRVRWNNDDRGVVPFDAGVSPTQWYEAARKWNAILKRKDVEYWVQLTPGRPLIFDNWVDEDGERREHSGASQVAGMLMQFVQSAGYLIRHHSDVDWVNRIPLVERRCAYDHAHARRQLPFQQSSLREDLPESGTEHRTGIRQSALPEPVGPAVPAAGHAIPDLEHHSSADHAVFRLLRDAVCVLPADDTPQDQVDISRERRGESPRRQPPSAAPAGADVYLCHA